MEQEVIIVEGPDGAGKSSLVKRLHEDTRLPIHVRASTSLGGPVANLWEWVVQDVTSWDRQSLSLYDRHPLVSEYIYGPICRGALPQGFMGHSSRNIFQQFQKQALVIFCMPPLELVLENVTNENLPQMEGVEHNISALYYSYAGTRSNWGGWAVDYDYTRAEGKGSYDSVRRCVRIHTATFRKV